MCRGAKRSAVRSWPAWSACSWGRRRRSKRSFVLAKPREALRQAGEAEHMGWDPRLSTRGNRVSKQLTVLLDRLAWIRNFLECHGWNSLMACDRLVLGPIFQRLSHDASCVAEMAGDLAKEMHEP